MTFPPARAAADRVWGQNWNYRTRLSLARERGLLLCWESSVLARLLVYVSGTRARIHRAVTTQETICAGCLPTRAPALLA